MRELKILCAVGVFMVALAGCESKPSPADIMRQRASDVKETVDLANHLAKEWERGSKLVQSGEKRVNSGNKMIKAAESDLKEGREALEVGNKEIAEGTRIMQESEIRFQENFPDRPLESIK